MASECMCRVRPSSPSRTILVRHMLRAMRVRMHRPNVIQGIGAAIGDRPDVRNIVIAARLGLGPGAVFRDVLAFEPSIVRVADLNEFATIAWTGASAPLR